MNIFLMTDMEGVAGVYDSENYCRETGVYYQHSRHLLTEEVNAAVRGFFKGGADAVRVQIGHNTDSIILEELDERATLVSGHHDPVWPWGLDDGEFDALAFAGQHAKAGTAFSHLAHTGNKGTLDQRVNGLSIGEYGSLALCAMELGIPTIFAAGEEALCREAEALTPGVVTVAGKRGITDDNGRTAAMSRDEYAVRNLGAEHTHPARVRRLLEAGAEQAVRKLLAAPESFRYPELKKPYYLVREYRRGCYPDKGSPAFGFVAESSSFIECMNRIYAPDAVKVSPEQVRQGEREFLRQAGICR